MIALQAGKLRPCHKDPAISRPSGIITIKWEDFGDEQEPNFRFSLHWEPPLPVADESRVTSLFRLITEMREAEQVLEWPADEIGQE